LDTLTCDYVVVGAGSAGCVVASRLSENPNHRVVLLEAGGARRHPYMRMPLAFYALLEDPSLQWPLVSGPEPYAADRVIPVNRGKVLGGTGAINGMTYARGDPGDYDNWAAAGATGWSYAEVLPYFKKSESNWRGETPYHGGSGPLSVSLGEVAWDPFFPAFMEAAKKLGEKINDDYCGADTGGFSRVEFTTHKGHRASTYQQFLVPAMSRPNLRVESRAQARRILIEGDRAVGVEYEQAGVLTQIRAEREVILCGGAYHSPHLLMLSGIGAPDELKKAGITPVHDLPGVGRNLQDHVGTGIVYAASQPITFEKELRYDRAVLSVLRWWLTGTGPMTQIPLTCWAFRKTSPELARADIQFFFSPVALNARLWFPGIRKGAGHIVTARNCLRYPASRGSVRLKSANPEDAPVVVSNMLQEPQDMKSLIGALRQTRELMSTEPLAGLVEKERMPGAAKTSDADLEGFLRQNARLACHPVGTCAMGSGEQAVLDARLRVRGLEGLRVADASVMPSIVGGNLNAPIIMIAEKAADMLLDN
jgi:choline dehydrogenase